MNAFELIKKFISETRTAFYNAKDDGNLWKANGLRKLYLKLLNLHDEL